MSQGKKSAEKKEKGKIEAIAMRRRFFWIFAVIVLMAGVYVATEKFYLGGNIQYQGKTELFGKIPVERYRLRNNGLQILLAPQSNSPVFSFQTWFRVGSGHEQEGKTGIAHLFEHMMFRETKNLKEGEFDRLMEENGAATNAATWVDWTYYRQTLPANKMDLVTRLEAERMQNLIIDEKALSREIDVVKNERRFRVDNSVDGTMYEELYKLSYKVHPYRHPTIGWMEDIGNFNVTDCQDFYKTYYAPNNATVVIVGKMDRKKTLKLINKYYGPIPASKIPVDNHPREPKQLREQAMTLLRGDLENEKLLMGFHVPAITNRKELAALELANEIMLDGKGSRLYKKLVRELELASSAEGWLPEWKDPGLYEISVNLKKGKSSKEVEKIVNEELDRLRAEAPSQQEMDRAKNRLELQLLSQFETTGGQAFVLGHWETTAGTFDLLKNMLEEYRAVKPVDVVQITKKYLIPDNRTTVVAFPKTSTEGREEKSGS